MRRSYDGASNRLQLGGSWARTGLPPAVTSATYDVANQQLTFAGQTITYDANGNMTSDGNNTYIWNARNQLIAISGASVTASFLPPYPAVVRVRRSYVADGPDQVLDAVGSREEPAQPRGRSSFSTVLGRPARRRCVLD